MLCNLSNAASHKYLRRVSSFLHSFSSLIGDRNNRIGEQGLSLGKSSAIPIPGVKEIRVKICFKESLQTAGR